MPPAPRPPASAARAVYIGLFASTVIVSGGAVAVSLSLGTSTLQTGALDWLALILGLGVFGIVLQRRNQLPRRAAGSSVEEWWRANAGATLVLWALLELTSVIGAVLLFSTGHVTVFAVLALLALAGMIRFAPGRLDPE